ncbi:MAG: F0F1 ATP synthase subunit delta [Alphaproteobacteria bacterium]|nr:F0F1 ATP synthase subunit delta [Alphaproteobacteria bacterium]
MAAAKAASTLAADRYAQALFELANEEGVLDAVAADIEGLGKLIAESADLERLVKSPIYSREQQGLAMAEILEKAGASDLTKKFIALVARNRRLFMLANIGRSFGRLLARQRGEIEASVTSAQPLSDAQIADLKATLRTAYGKEPRLSVAVDQSLIAGLIVKVGSRMIDSSLRTKLNSLKTVLTEA